jgi:hypothetical protein
MVKKSVKNIKKDFEVFSQGVQRLEELKTELNALNVKGYEAEAAGIRSKLKNVSEIPSIEVALQKLKDKLSGKYKSKKKAKLQKNLLVEKIKKIEKDVKVKSKSSASKSAAYTRKINKMQEDLALLKKQSDKQKKDEQRKRLLLMRIDPTVDMTVNEMFGLSLEEIKAELSRKIKSKETELQKQLRQNVDAKEQEYKVKGTNLREKYHQLYLTKLEKELDRQVKKRFSKLLKDSIRKQKVRLSKDELRKFRQKAQQEFDKRREGLKKSLTNNLEDSKQSIKQHYEEELLLQKHLLDKKFEQLVGDEVSRLKFANEQKERIVLGKLQENRLRELNSEFAKKKLDLEKELDLRVAFANKQKERLQNNIKAKKKELLRKIKEEQELISLLRLRAKDSKNLFRSKLKVLLQNEKAKRGKLRKELGKLGAKDSFLARRLKFEIARSLALVEEAKRKELKIVSKDKTERKLRARIHLLQQKMEIKQNILNKETNDISSLKKSNSETIRIYSNRISKLNDASKNLLNLKISEIYRQETAKRNKEREVLSSRSKTRFNEEVAKRKKIVKELSDKDKLRIKKEVAKRKKVEGELMARAKKTLEEEIVKKERIVHSLTTRSNTKSKELNNHLSQLRKEEKELMNNLQKEKDRKMEILKESKGKDIQLFLRDKTEKEMRSMIDKFRRKSKTDKLKLADELKKTNSLKEANSKLEQDYAIKEAKLREKLEQEKEEGIRYAVNKRIALLRGSMEREFEARLRTELEKKEAALQQKKIALEQEIQEKARLLFK